MITNRLDDKKILALLNKDEINKIFIDIDYTVLDFGKGNEGGTKKLNEYYHDLGNSVSHIFELILKAKRNFDALNNEEKREHSEIMDYFKELQNGVSEKSPIKYWSREMMIVMSAKKIGLKLKNGGEIEKISKIYWEAVANNSKLFEDAIGFLNTIKQEKIPIVWVTGSDSVLKVKMVKENFRLDYDPKYSWKTKEKRLKEVLKDYPGKLIIGDPIDKPEIWHNLLKRLDTKKILVVGDSYDADLKYAENLGIKTVLIER